MKRRRWVALVALLRAVGHVLEKVDGPVGCQARRQAIASGYQALKRTEIFNDFIESQRNSVLKEYEFPREEPGEVAQVYSDAAPDLNGRILAGSKLKIRIGETDLLADGPFRGQERAAVARRAIDALHRYLADVELADCV